MNADRPYLPALTGLRALMAWDVFLFHFSDAPDAPRWWIAFTEGGGEMGVSLFFVLSGFLLAHRYAQKVELTSQWIRNYLFRRFARIYPLFFTISALSYLVVWLLKPDFVFNHTSTLLHFTLLKGFFPNHIFYFISTTWSLTVEEIFYLLAPLIFLLLPKIKLGFQCLILMLVGLVTVFLYEPSVLSDYSHAASFVLYWTFWGRAFQFSCGIFLALWLSRHPVKTRNHWITTLLGIIAVVAAQMIYKALHPIHLLGSEDLMVILYNDFIAPLAIAFFFYAIIRERSLFSRLMEGRLFQLLGKSSFAFYLLHLSPLVMVFYRQHRQPALIMFIAVQLLSILFYRCIEHPLHDTLIRWKNQNKMRASAKSQVN